MNRERKGRPVFYHRLNVLFRQAGAVRNLGNNLLIVVGNPHLLGEPPAKFAPAASKFTSNRNDPLHTHSSFTLNFFVYLIISQMT